MKTLGLSICLLSLFMFIYGCSPSNVKLYEGRDLPDSQISKLTTDSKDVTIEKVNNKSFFTIGKFWNSKWNAVVSLKPGEHLIEARYWNGPTLDEHINSYYYFILNTVASNNYTVRHKVVNKSVALWIENSATGEKVGDIISSMNEAIIDNITPLKNSIYYTMIPPSDNGWVIAYRNKNQTNLAKYGNQQDETYAISVSLFELPSFDSKDDFLNYIQLERGKNSDPGRFNIKKNDQSFYDKRKDYCVDFHLVTEDSKAVTKSSNNENMILEVAGYSCRLPNNKNIGINFSYSKRFYSGNNEANIMEKASEYFKLLSF